MPDARPEADSLGVGGASTTQRTETTTYQTSTDYSGTESRSVGEIVGDIAKDLSTLVRQEIDLAKTEAKQEASKAAKGAGMLGGAGVAGHMVLVFLSLCLMFLLDSWMHLALAALIVTVLWGIVAAVLAMRGKKQLKNTDPKLETTQRTLKEDVQWAKEQKNR
jgi:uncharacterized membrane protein YqjE